VIARFVRHLRARWEVHRHRLPPQLWQRVEALRNQQRLQVHAGRILRLRVLGEQIQVTWRPRGAAMESSCARIE
jgi:uncharacterized NAD(P)/FAD-binding protein YdhS